MFLLCRAFSAFAVVVVFTRRIASHTIPPLYQDPLLLICSSHSSHDCALVGLNNYSYDSFSLFFFLQGGQFTFFFFTSFLVAISHPLPFLFPPLNRCISFFSFLSALFCFANLKSKFSLTLLDNFIVTSTLLYIYLFSFFYSNVRYDLVFFFYKRKKDSCFFLFNCSGISSLG